jgi:hypothetical protein
MYGNLSFGDKLGLLTARIEDEKVLKEHLKCVKLNDLVEGRGCTSISILNVFLSNIIPKS